jgi:hypothetical protein
MENGSELKNIFESKPEGRRRITKPKNLLKMKFKGWRQKTMDRECN